LEDERDDDDDSGEEKEAEANADGKQKKQKKKKKSKKVRDRERARKERGRDQEESKVEQDFYLEEHEDPYFILMCLLADLQSVRKYVKDIWIDYKAGKVDLMTVSVVND
jgi:hypothetical protein